MLVALRVSVVFGSGGLEVLSRGLVWFWFVSGAVVLFPSVWWFSFNLYFSGGFWVLFRVPGGGQKLGGNVAICFPTGYLDVSL